MNIYLAGPMSGKKDHNFPAFFAAAKQLRKQGHTVFSPAEVDLEDYTDHQAIHDDEAKRGFHAVWRERLAVDFEWIMLKADAVFVLPGWEESWGVNAELALADALYLEIVYLDE